jgi:Tfp pilus assembly protein PilZ
MHAVEAEFSSRAALRDGLLDTYVEGGIFVPGHYGITSGSPILVRVSAAGLEAGVFLEGVVQWRRVGVARAPELTAGIGVRLLASQHERFTFLQRWANAAHAGSGRMKWRYPCDVKAFVATRGSGTGRVLHATLRDVCDDGAMIAVPAKIAVGTPIAVEFPVANDAHGVNAEIVWAEPARAGMRLVERDARHDGWRALVQEAVGAFGRRVVTPRSPSEPATR